MGGPPGDPPEKLLARIRTLPRLYLITDRARLGEEALARAVEAAGKGGLRMLQVREKELPAPEMARLITRLRALLPAGALVIASATGRSPGFAREVGADGAHLGGGDLRALSEARRALPGGFLLGYSAHRREEIGEAARRGADYASLSPVFDPLSKPASVPAVGIEGLRAACASSPIPIYALGGLGARRAAEARAAGAFGAAVMGALLDSSDPRRAAGELIRELGEEEMA